MAALNMSTVLAVTRGHATKSMSTSIRITDRPFKRIPRDTLCLLLLETLSDTQREAQHSTSYHDFCGDLRKT